MTQQILRVNKYVWLCLAFVLAYLYLGEQQRPFDAPRVFIWAIVGIAILSVAARTYIAIWHHGGRAGHWNRVFNYIDIVIIAIAIEATHGIESPIWLIYFPLIIFASLYSTPMSKHAVSICVTVFYALATFPHQFHHRTGLPYPVYLLTLETNLFFLLLVSGLASRLGSDAEEHNAEVMRLREQMASSEERARIAREVHDSLGHMMVSTLLRLELCRRLMDSSPDEAKEMLEVEIPVLRSAWNEARDMAFHLRPWDIDPTAGGLVAALRDRCRKFAERTGIVVEVIAEDENYAIKPDRSFGLMRIVQETLTNAAKHSGATRIEVRLFSIKDAMIRCEISDNGKGFESRESSDGVGITAMQERARALGGTVTVSTAPKHGVKVTVEIPV